MSAHATHRCAHCANPTLPGRDLCAACLAQVVVTRQDAGDALTTTVSDDLIAIIVHLRQAVREKSEVIVTLQGQIERQQHEIASLSEELTVAMNAELAERAHARHLKHQLDGLRQQVMALTNRDPLHTQNGGLLRTIRRFIGR